MHLCKFPGWTSTLKVPQVRDFFLQLSGRSTWQASAKYHIDGSMGAA